MGSKAWYSETCLNLTSFKPTFVFQRDVCSFYTRKINKDFSHLGVYLKYGLNRIPFYSGGGFRQVSFFFQMGSLWLLSYGSWIYIYLCNQCLSLLMLWVRISIRVRCTASCDKVCQWLLTGWWFSLGPQVSSTNKNVCHYIAEILLKVALNTIKQTNKQTV